MDKYSKPLGIEVPHTHEHPDDNRAGATWSGGAYHVYHAVVMISYVGHSMEY